MTLIYFLIILAALILIHELGHFLVAKATGMRVDEFGLGFPPRLAKIWKKDETEYTLNLLPIGGFVKIFGENYDDINELPENEKNRSFVSKSKTQQALVLVAGVTFNMVFAWLLISAGYLIGLPTPVDYNGAGEVKDPRVIVTSVMEGSPAEEAGIEVGDAIASVSAGEESLTELNTEGISGFIQSNPDSELSISLNRGSETLSVNTQAVEGISEGREVIGIQMNSIGTLQLPIHLALWQGFITTGEVTVAIAIGITQFLYQAITGVADYSQVAGPVGIVDLVGDATTLGFIYVLQFAAFISINLAIINLLPIPALDGGRLLFVAIESIKGSPINPKVAHALNATGFILLILLMIAVTYNDILRLI